MYFHKEACAAENCDIGGDNDNCPFTDDNKEMVIVLVTAGETYRIEWTDWLSKDGFDWTLEYFEDPIIGGQDCATALSITPGPQMAVIVADSGGASACSGDESAAWFKFVAPSNGSIDVNSCASDVDTALYIHSSACGEENCATGGDDDECPDSNGESIDSFPVVRGHTYYIEWTDNEGAAVFPWSLVFTRSEAVPTVSQWGAIAMGLALLVAATTALYRRRDHQL